MCIARHTKSRCTLWLAFAGLLCCALGAVAAPPPGHPTPADGMRLMQPLVRPGDVPLSRTGTVISHTDANQYTYIEISENGRQLWLAAPRIELINGSSVRFPDGVVMRNFYSKLLKRSFDAVIFVRAVEPVGR